MLALRWIDVDLDQRLVSISRSVERTKRHGHRVTTPKTANSIRRFQADAGLAAILRPERERQGGASPLVFPGARGFRNEKTTSTMFRLWAARLGFNLHFHSLRASHGTALLDRGVPVHTLAARLGRDPATLLRIYAKRTKKSDAAAAAREMGLICPTLCPGGRGFARCSSQGADAKVLIVAVQPYQ